ncbi:MAG: MBOAT family O-acyltransferase [Planctomycetota bacterium]
MPPARVVRFDTVTFWLFFPLAWAVWRLLPLRAAKAGTLALSLVFYAWWRPEYVVLIWLSSYVDYRIAGFIHAAHDERVRQRWLTVSLAGNLGLLAFFKYTPLIATTLGFGGDATTGKPEWLAAWVVPVGISFYTFQTLSYTIDVHARRLKPAASYFDFFLFVSFFPQLVAGPIVRARELLPQLQFRRPLSWPRIQLGLYRCIEGLFLKIVVADGLAPQVENAFRASTVADISPTQAWIGAVCFGAQIFADFAGYSWIAIGLALLMGFNFPENFRYPYISRSLTEFWTRWHITLSRWLRDYLYVPLGGNRAGAGRTYVNLMVTMLLGGLWHGASWSFLAWGGLHGLALAVERAFGWTRVRAGMSDPLRGPVDFVMRALRVVIVYVVVHVAWVFFRASDFTLAVAVLERMFVAPFTTPLGLEIIAQTPQLLLLVPIVALHAGQAAHEWLGLKKSAPLRLAVCVVWLVLLVLVDRGAASPFLYFQF